MITNLVWFLADPYGEVDGNHKILAPPPRPINLQCAVESPTSLLLTWESPISSALRTSYYTVKYHLKRSRNPQQKTLTVETKSIILNGLRSEKVYDIFVQSHYKTKTSRFQSEHSTAQIDCSITLPGKLKSLYIHNTLHVTQKYAQIFVCGHYLFQEVNGFPRVKLEESCELRGTDNVQAQISEHIFAAILRLLCLLAIGFKNWGISSNIPQF